MSYSEHEDKLLTKSHQQPITPASLPREIEYEPESDTLWIGNGRPSPNGMDLFDGCIIFFDEEKRVSGIMVEDAKELLLPILNGENSGHSKSETPKRATE